MQNAQLIVEKTDHTEFVQALFEILTKNQSVSSTVVGALCLKFPQIPFNDIVKMLNELDMSVTICKKKNNNKLHD